MAQVNLSLGPKLISASGTSVIDVELVARVHCFVTLSIAKPQGSVITVKRKARGASSLVDLIVSANATNGVNLFIENIEMWAGDQIEIDIDATSGNKEIAAQVGKA